jgi:hypothetical protein
MVVRLGELLSDAGIPPPRAVLLVAAVGGTGTWPELGQVCLRCVDHDLELLGRWAEIERDLCDPTRRRYERALVRFIE